MKASSILIGLAAIGLLLLLYVHVLHISVHFDASPLLKASLSGRRDGEDGGTPMQIQQLLNLIRSQNETIATLSSLLETNNKAGTTTPASVAKSLRERDALIRTLKSKLLKSNASSAECPQQQPCPQQTPLQQQQVQLQSPSVSPFLAKGIDGECERAYGMSLVDEWRGNAQTWCQSDATNSFPESKLVCYPLHQAHKKRDGRGPDLFCQATNFFIDFSKVHGGHVMSGKPPLGQQYYNFREGSLSSPCKPTSQYRRNLFMPHHALQMDSFEAESKLPASGSFTVEETPTYLLARDEDCENSFHSTADFMNMFLVLTALRQAPQSLQVMLFDRHSDGPYVELIQKAFSGGRPPIRKEAYRNGKVLFRSLIFHLESPAGLIFPKVSRPDPMRCRSASLFTNYVRFVLDAFGLWDVTPPPIPQVLLSLRHRTETKNVGRVLANEKEVVGVLREGNMLNLEVVDTASMPYGRQLELIRKTNVLVGVHGAGLMLIMFAANEAVLVELHPSYRQDRHFRHAARMTGKIYMPLRSTARETCHGSSDNVVVPIDEFRRTMDGALRLARNFDDGISECGLYCNPGILALDTRLQPYYKPGEARAQSVNTVFPC